MITVFRFRGKKAWKVGDYTGSPNNMKDVFNALDLARKEGAKGKLVVGGVEVPDRPQREPEIK